MPSECILPYYCVFRPSIGVLDEPTVLKSQRHAAGVDWLLREVLLVCFTLWDKIRITR
jgi:hypothetical protein